MSGDHTDFNAFIRRVLAAYARRCADADPEDLAELLAVRAAVDDAITRAVAGLRTSGRSWSEIATATGTTKQAAQQRWGVKVALTPNRPAASAVTDGLPEPTDHLQKPSAAVLAG